jgi:hypothetical protein
LSGEKILCCQMRQVGCPERVDFIGTTTCRNYDIHQVAIELLPEMQLTSSFVEDKLSGASGGCVQFV